MNFKQILESKEYDFLRNNEHLKDNILFLVVSGSYAYGTNIETSDLDIRGVALERETDILGLTNFEQYIDKYSDTVIYSLKKFLKLAKECNPNIIEMLYSEPCHYFYVSPLGRIILENRDLFLTKRAVYTFGGYAYQQLSRIQNAYARDKLTDHRKLEHITRSIENVSNAFEINYKIPQNSIKAYVGTYQNKDNEEILVDLNLSHYPLSRLKNLVDNMNNVTREYNETIGARNGKNEDAHLNKRMMHLIRLYLMCNEILEYNTLHTYRKKEHDLLMSIRYGEFRDSEGQISNEFFTLLDSLKEKCEKLKSETKLLDSVDCKKFNELVLSLYRKARL